MKLAKQLKKANKNISCYKSIIIGSIYYNKGDIKLENSR